jgi:hypothetical protein
MSTAAFAPNTALAGAAVLENLPAGDREALELLIAAATAAAVAAAAAAAAAPAAPAAPKRIKKRTAEEAFGDDMEAARKRRDNKFAEAEKKRAARTADGLKRIEDSLAAKEAIFLAAQASYTSDVMVMQGGFTLRRDEEDQATRVAYTARMDSLEGERTKKHLAVAAKKEFEEAKKAAIAAIRVELNCTEKVARSTYAERQKQEAAPEADESEPGSESESEDSD